MTVRENSLAAYWSLRDSGKLGERELQVLEAIERFGPITRQELPAVTGMPINCISGRCANLLAKELIVEEGSKRNERTGKDNALLKLAMVQMEMAV